MKRKQRFTVTGLEREGATFRDPATEKERAVIEAAAALIGERGIDGATTAEIAKRAKVTEKTLFRYFPSKKALVRRVLFPMLLEGGLEKSWQDLETMIRTRGTDLKSWYVAFSVGRHVSVVRNPGLTRTMIGEMIYNEPLRAAIGKIWEKHIWKPMIERLEELRAAGAIRDTVELRTLARIIHSLNIGFFFTRFVFAPGEDWDDVAEFEKMADILAYGAAGPRKLRR